MQNPTAWVDKDDDINGVDELSDDADARIGRESEAGKNIPFPCIFQKLLMMTVVLHLQETRSLPIFDTTYWNTHRPAIPSVCTCVCTCV